MTSEAEYMRDYRRRNPGVIARQTKVERARRRALNELSRIHQMDYLVLLAKYRKEEGLD